MGSEEVWEMKETVLNDTTPMLNKVCETDGTRRDTRVAIYDDNTRGDEERSYVPASGNDVRYIDWSRRRSSAMFDEKPLSLREHERRYNERWKMFNHNRYATRKTAAQGMMDMALMLANASQLKSVVQEGRSHEHYLLLLTLISTSICLQIFTGIILLVVGARESQCEDDQHQRNKKTSKLNNFSIGLVFVITVTNIFITSFGINGNTSSLTTSGLGSGESRDAVGGIGNGTD
ncbi:ninjurin-2-like [Liolophura sinensis]|uniref:ninjurin-2-like n=1 Tax=Liolophura sinensis TaxID=3198878 RepID=UPI003158F102